MALVGLALVMKGASKLVATIATIITRPESMRPLPEPRLTSGANSFPAAPLKVLKA
jgi:hypothetical protein